MNFKALIVMPLVMFLAFGYIFADDEHLDFPDESGESSVIPAQNKKNLFLEKMTGKEVEAYLRSEYNRSNVFYGELSLLGGVEFFDQLRFKAGISVGRSENVTDVNTLIRVNYSPFKAKYARPLSFSLAYIFNGIPEYEANMNSLFPYITYGASRAGLSLGINLRFSSHFGEEAQFESRLSFLGYVNFINTEAFQVGISAGTFSDFHAKNLGAYSLKLNVLLNLDKNWSIINEVEVMQSGGDGFSTTFYGFAWRGGARFSW